MQFTVLIPQRRTSIIRHSKKRNLLTFYFCRSYLPSWIRIQIRIAHPNPRTPLNPDPVRIRSTALPPRREIPYKQNTVITSNGQKSFDILACISDSYLRLTTAHTQEKKIKIKKYYSVTPHLPLKVVIGSIFVFSSIINIEYDCIAIYLIPSLQGDIAYSFIT